MNWVTHTLPIHAPPICPTPQKYGSVSINAKRTETKEYDKRSIMIMVGQVTLISVDQQQERHQWLLINSKNTISSSPRTTCTSKLFLTDSPHTQIFFNKHYSMQPQSPTSPSYLLGGCHYNQLSTQKKTDTSQLFGIDQVVSHCL